MDNNIIRFITQIWNSGSIHKYGMLLNYETARENFLFSVLFEADFQSFKFVLHIKAGILKVRET